MKKSYTKAELATKAKAVFKNNTKAKAVFATTDGNIFLSQNRADLHAGADGKVFEIENENAPEKPKAEKSTQKGNKVSPAKAAKALVIKIGTLATVEEVKAVTERATAKTVKAAAKARIEELNAASNAGASSQEEE